MREVDYTDDEGRWHRVLLPESAPDSAAHRGIPVGPPDLRALELPRDVEIRLHNQLFHRRLFTERDVRARGHDVLSALQSALRVSVQAITNVYANPPEVEVPETVEPLERRANRASDPSQDPDPAT